MTDPKDLTTGELVGRLSEEVTRLVRDELALATAELKDKGKQAGVGAVLGGTAVALAWFGAAALVLAAVAALALVLPVWAAALIVGAVLLLAAGLAGALGTRKIKHAIPPIPEQAIESTRRDIAAVKEGAHR
ncbi:phage holin family protein [Actinokineospora sp. HUAS TT18]|uniref:phage holin family protein n=1 Tax=Actinokineospora sp. HUAS TT18 TaxID=3447451 RepID=UPI003F51CDBB